MRSAVAIARALVSAYGVDTIVGHEDISRGRKWDPGPAFELDRMRASVFGGRGEAASNAFKVAALEGLNLRDGPSTSAKVLKVLPFETHVDVLRRSNGWAEVSVLSPAGNPDFSGWVNFTYLS